MYSTVTREDLSRIPAATLLIDKSPDYLPYLPEVHPSDSASASTAQSHVMLLSSSSCHRNILSVTQVTISVLCPSPGGSLGSLLL